MAGVEALSLFMSYPAINKYARLRNEKHWYPSR